MFDVRVWLIVGAFLTVCGGSISVIKHKVSDIGNAAFTTIQTALSNSDDERFQKGIIKLQADHECDLKQLGSIDEIERDKKLLEKRGIKGFPLDESLPGCG